jgi:hypothetical protein
MTMRQLLILVLGLPFVHAACSQAVLATDASANANANVSSQSSSASTASFTGRNGQVNVNGDLVRAKNGVLTVNGAPYGRVNEDSVVTYTVRGSERILSVDGVVRKPER